MRVPIPAALMLMINLVALGQTKPLPANSIGANQRARIRMTAGQPPSGGTGEPSQSIPAYVVYRFFFLHLESLDQFAAQLEAKGKAGTPWRTHEQRASGLSEEEGQILKDVAYHCNQAVKDVDTKATSLISAFRAQHPNMDLAKFSPPPELLSFHDDRISAINSSIDELHAKLGDQSFAKLDHYVQTIFKSSVRTIPTPPTKPGKSPGGVQ